MNVKVIDKQSYYYDKIGEIISYAEGELYFYVFVKFSETIKIWFDYTQLEIIPEENDSDTTSVTDTKIDTANDTAQDTLQNIKGDIPTCED